MLFVIKQSSKPELKTCFKKQYDTTVRHLKTSSTYSTSYLISHYFPKKYYNLYLNIDLKRKTMTVDKSNFAFGSRVKRFGKITVHPNLDPSGLYTERPDGCDPCLYYPTSIKDVYQVNKNRTISDKDPWKYKSELEDWSKNLGYRNQKILDYKRWYNSVLGPAWHEIVNMPTYQAACKNVGFGRTPRFKPAQNNIPGPGTYYKSKLTTLKECHSFRPTFERGEPCRFKDIVPKWSLAPNRYTIIQKEDMEHKSKKIVSLRGPYDLFTGKRDGSTIKNHFNESGRSVAATWPFALKGCLETYKNSHFGEMNKTNRALPYRGRNALVDLSMALKRSDEPGPSHYNTDLPKTFDQNKKAFNSSCDKPPGYKRVIVWPGVGRYHNVKGNQCGIPGHGHRHVFLSKQKRTIGAILPELMNSF